MTDTKQKLEGMRFSKNKMNFWSSIPKDALVELMRVYYTGAVKYDENNWLKGMKYSEMANPLERHWMKWSMGLTTDSKETKCHHLAMVAWNAIGLLTYELRGIGEDDRVKLPIDEDFNWISGPAAAMDLGLSDQELQDLAAKYQKNKVEFKRSQEAEKQPEDLTAEEVSPIQWRDRTIPKKVLDAVNQERKPTDPWVHAKLLEALGLNEEMDKGTYQGRLARAVKSAKLTHAIGTSDHFRCVAAEMGYPPDQDKYDASFVEDYAKAVVEVAKVTENFFDVHAFATLLEQLSA